MVIEDATALRAHIQQLMDDGLQTQTAPFPETNLEFNALLNDLAELGDEQLTAKLQLSGFVNQPFGPEAMCCEQCMYYLVHRKWCDLPELAVPVEPHWWCRLWRI